MDFRRERLREEGSIKDLAQGPPDKKYMVYMIPTPMCPIVSSSLLNESPPSLRGSLGLCAGSGAVVSLAPPSRGVAWLVLEL